jgi:S-adenosylmethionine:tRNA ribosyltransferase-isomerase
VKLEKLLKQYDYHVPQQLIAQRPARPRDSARLLVYDRKTKRTQFDTFRNLGKYLPPKAVLVFNQTKVIPARLTLTKRTGGRVRVLYIATEGKYIRVLADRALSHAETLRLTKRYSFTVVKRVNAGWLLKPSFFITQLKSIFDRFGVAPLPPYIKHSPLTEAERKAQYQTVFAKRSGSVAAPTASLHFTKSLIAKLKRQDFGVEYVTLHVNLGTFAPLTEVHLKTNQLHSEWYEVNSTTAKRLNAAREQGGPIVAVGTTVVRTLESTSNARGHLRAKVGETRLFIQPGYKFRFVNNLITNFHVPQSSLMMLTAALTGRDQLLAIYQGALEKKFRFFSFGDGMFVM